MLTKTSYNVIIERFRAFAEGHYLIRRFSHGQVDVVDIVQDNEYPWMHVVPVSMTPADGSMAYEFDVIFADLPRDKETPTEYQRESLSDCIRLAEDLISEIKNGGVIFGDEVTLDTGTTIEPFIEEYTHTLTGVNCKLSMTFANNWSACDIPADWAIGGSGSGGAGGGGGTSIVLRTNGTDNAIQTILDVVEGANMTITDLGDGRVQFDATGDIGTTWGTIGGVLSNQTDLQDVLDLKADITSLAAVALSGDYGDLDNLPTIPTLTSELTNDSGFITIGDVPTQVNSDWNAVSGVEEILNKPSLAAVATSGDYDDLTNLPSIPTSLDDLTDVFINAGTLVTGQSLIYDAGSGYFKNDDLPSGTGTVTSVALTMPSAFSVSGTPVTTSGTLAVTGSGIAAQYIDGTGALQTFPTLPPTIGDMLKSIYDTDADGVVDSAERIEIVVRNSTGVTLTKGQVVYLSGATGNRPNALLADASIEATSSKTIGLVTENIANNADGFVAVNGTLHNLDTSAFTAGDTLWLSETAGAMQANTPPPEPAHAVFIGYVARSHPTLGRIALAIQNGYELNELHGVSVPTPSANDYFYYNGTTSLWENRQLTASHITDSTTVGRNLLTLPNPSAISFIRVNADDTVTARTPAEVLTDLGVSATIILGRDFVGTSVVNTTTNTIAFSALIAPNTLQVNDFIEVISLFNTNVLNGQVVTYRLYWNTTNSLTGAVQLASLGNSVGTGNTAFLRNIYVTAIGASGNIRINGANVTNPYSLSSAPASNITINTTSNIYILIGIQMGNATSTSSTQGTLIRLTR